jgi:hypothetical protein
VSKVEELDDISICPKAAEDCRTPRRQAIATAIPNFAPAFGVRQSPAAFSFQPSWQKIQMISHIATLAAVDWRPWSENFGPALEKNIYDR